MFRLQLIVITLFISLSTFANHHEKYELKNLHVGVNALSQNKGESYSGIIRYSPLYKLNEKIKLGVSLDVSPLKLNDDTTFMAFGYLANGHYQINERFGVQASVGMQTWTCTNCMTAFTAGVMGSYGYSPSWFKYMNQVFVQYLKVNQESNANQFVVGAGLSF